MGKTFLKANQVQLDRQIILPRPTFGGMVTFWFDDGPSTDYTALYPLFEAQGEVGALSIITNTADTEGGGITWEQINIMATAGWEITNHTVDHLNLTTLTESEIVDEFEDSQARFIANGITPTILAYPNNASNFLVRKIAREYFRAARGTQGNTINKYTLDTFNLASIVIDDWTDLQTFKDLILQAYRQQRWIIFYGHSGAYEAGDLEDLDELIDYAQSLGVDIVTPTQALESFENYAEYGDGFGISERQIRLNAQTLYPDFEPTGGAATYIANVAVSSYDEIEFGTAGTAEIDFDQSIDLALAASTIMFEFRPHNGSADPFIFEDSATGNYIRWRGSLGAWYFYQDASHYSTFSGLSIPDDTKVHVAFVMSGTHVTGYVNGTLIAVGTTTFTTPLSMDKITNGGSTPPYFRIGNIRVWNGTALTQAEVQTEMYSRYAVKTTGLTRQIKGNHYLGTAGTPTYFANVKQFDLLLQ